MEMELDEYVRQVKKMMAMMWKQMAMAMAMAMGELVMMCAGGGRPPPAIS